MGWVLRATVVVLLGVLLGSGVGLELLRRALIGKPAAAVPWSEELKAELDRARAATSKLNAAVAQESYLVIGGSGFTGGYVVEDLVARGAKSVRVMSRNLPKEHDRIKGAEYFRGSLTDAAQVRKALDGVTVVFQLAAYTGTPNFGYRSPDDRQRAVDVNKGGIETVIKESKKANIKLLVLTSSVDVVFNPYKGFVNATENELDYVTSFQGRLPCHYQNSKIMTEKALLAADQPGGMRTMAIRPGGIYGPGEVSAIPKILDAGWYTGWHFLAFENGSPELGKDQLIDWTFAYNIAFAHVLAVDLLNKGKGDAFGGKPYFINDENPLPATTGEIFRPVVEAAAIRLEPIFTVSREAALHVAEFGEWLHEKTGILPMLTVHEMHKPTTTHTNSCQRARKDLGWYPIISHDLGWRLMAQDVRLRLAAQQAKSKFLALFPSLKIPIQS